ncbi:hypothetical protein AWB64_02677 [Caballeronia sordidicola]|uniref:Uncharacterized protein n=1 Tax=Caballeronia sordidicola TaxID=196367 RepID=A0A158GEV5_CABSO|nr:hypothetical protein AWB64_02677 [Caballeronia sordidicola]
MPPDHHVMADNGLRGSSRSALMTCSRALTAFRSQDKHERSFDDGATAPARIGSLVFSDDTRYSKKNLMRVP